MLTFENMAAFVCHYGGTPKVDLMRMYRENMRKYDETGEIRYRKKAQGLLAMVKMMDRGVEFIEHPTTTTFYFEPNAGWDILYDYLDDPVLH
ncbi:hypothetical protein [Ammoniphilus sp. CFH 90114]|uniref:hypothetical protein n=1 Tax=Ammoniphilus sp. CFH 90114 TaxID=2493665 RepID=UPI00100F5096|nr:hypothetical protein [Ammoniphilus sp. CFH 90114]RXT02865.1 hypothetical protein EIZ39_24045 [Ammoniphilus sp. CFH 90114]